MRKKFALTVLWCLLFGAEEARPQEIWVGKDGNIRNVDTRGIIVGSDWTYLATKREIYRSRDMKDKWEEVFSIPSGENEITCLDARGASVLAGTCRGLFRSDDGARTWRNVFRTIMPDKNNITCLEISKYNPKRVLIGTQKGIFASEDSGSNWRDISGNLKNKRISCLALSKDTLYAGGDEGLYRRRDGAAGWERVFVSSAAVTNKDEEVSGNTESSGESEEENSSTVNCIAFKGSRLYIGLDRKILYSDDSGKSWNAFFSGGLNGTINYLITSRKSDKMYCATTKGVFEFTKDEGRWIELYKGMEKALAVNSVAFGDEAEKTLWAMTDRGLYRLESGKYLSDGYIDIERNLKSFSVISDNEPAFKELQQAALKYGDVSPDKIRRWQRESRLKALVPKVRVGTYKHVATNYEIYTSATRDYVTTGPDDVTNGLDMSVSWDLAGLIWSDDQTNIDVRSRLTTQLRNDILDDLRRVYYERKRLQFEMMANPPADMKAKFDKELRIQELTQAIDDLTGNYLSEHMKKSQEPA